jgi:hypothetical protein
LGRLNNNASRKASGELYMQDRVNMQHSSQPALNHKAFGEGLREENNISRGQGSIDFSHNNSVLQESRQKIRESVQYQEEKLQRLESSQVKTRQIKNEMEVLEEERRKITLER